MTACLTSLVIRNIAYSYEHACGAERRVLFVTRKQCADFTWPSISHALGLFRGDKLEGIVTFYLANRAREHRYIRFIGSREFKRKAVAALRYEKTNYLEAVMG